LESGIFVDNSGCNVVGMYCALCFAMCFCNGFAMWLECVLQWVFAMWLECVFAMHFQKETTICLWTGFFFPGRWVGDLPQEVLAKLGNRAERTISIN
jgi:hypothetical protein